ncbi:manganese efflux pump MntP family protein [Bacillus spongiae]|uniref:Putative manganese efflux pump MntP n=1 Tax=Bacillus spongiae TaxID=2683610 RepID=A0ABU8HIA4_9BACI
MAAYFAELITLIIMAFALGMDAFSIGVGMGMFQLRLRQIVYIGITVGMFHVVMPLGGILAGQFLSSTFGTLASFVGGALLMLLGLQMFWASFQEADESVITPVGGGVFIFALSVSLDSFSVGLTLGIYGARVVLAIMCFGIIATMLTWSGLLIGQKVGGWLGRYSEALGGMILFFFGVKLLCGG